MPVGAGLPRLQVEWSAASSSSSSDSDGPWRTDPAESAAETPSSEQGREIVPAGGEAEAAGALGHAAFFEALVRANTETVIRVRRTSRTASITALPRTPCAYPPVSLRCAPSCGGQLAKARSRHSAERVGWPPAQCSHTDAAAAPGAPSGSSAAAGGVWAAEDRGGGVWAAEDRGSSTSGQALVAGAQPLAEVRAAA